MRAGVEAETLEKAPGSEGRLRADFHAIANEVAHGDPLAVGVKFRELPYFLQEARQKGFDLPWTQVLYHYLAEKERVTIDDHRLAPSFRHELPHPSSADLEDGNPRSSPNSATRKQVSVDGIRFEFSKNSGYDYGTVMTVQKT